LDANGWPEKMLAGRFGPPRSPYRLKPNPSHAASYKQRSGSTFNKVL
jgi:hypothetical protein